MFGGGTEHIALSFIPIYNSTKCIAGIFSMSCTPTQVLITILSNLVVAGLFAWILTRMFHSEKVMFKK
jgi:hypothetical protein